MTTALSNNLNELDMLLQVSGGFLVFVTLSNILIIMILYLFIFIILLITKNIPPVNLKS